MAADALRRDRAFAGILARRWGLPAGGILTQLFDGSRSRRAGTPSPADLAALYGVRFTPTLRPLERPPGANAAFSSSPAHSSQRLLLVILLINGWRLEPLQAGAVVTVSDLGDPGRALRERGSPPLGSCGVGVILISGGLAALGWLPEPARPGRFPRSSPSVQVSASPSRRSRSARSRAAVAGASRRLDARRAARRGRPRLCCSLDLHGRPRAKRRRGARKPGRPTSRQPASRHSGDRRPREIPPPSTTPRRSSRPRRRPDRDRARDEPAYTDLAGSLQDQLDRAATNAFSRSFLAAALLGSRARAIPPRPPRT